MFLCDVVVFVGVWCLVNVCVLCLCVCVVFVCCLFVLACVLCVVFCLVCICLCLCCVWLGLFVFDHVCDVNHCVVL